MFQPAIISAIPEVVEDERIPYRIMLYRWEPAEGLLVAVDPEADPGADQSPHVRALVRHDG